MWLQIPFINWVLGIVFIYIGTMICLIPFILLFKLYNNINTWWFKTLDITAKYTHLEKKLWRFRFSYYKLRGQSQKKTIRLEYSEGW